MMRLCALLALMVAMVVGFRTTAVAQDKKEAKEEKKGPDIKKVMHKSFDEDGFRAKVKDALKDKDFEAASKVAKEWSACCKGLENSTPPLDPKMNWAKAAKALQTTLAKLEKACADKDADAATTIVTKGINCGGCHNVYKPKKK